MEEAPEGRFTFGRCFKPYANTVRLGHPDAAAALASRKHEEGAQFFAPPFVYIVLKTVPGARAALRFGGVIGDPLSQSTPSCTTAFAEPTPRIIVMRDTSAEPSRHVIERR